MIEAAASEPTSVRSQDRPLDYQPPPRRRWGRLLRAAAVTGPVLVLLILWIVSYVRQVGYEYAWQRHDGASYRELHWGIVSTRGGLLFGWMDLFERETPPRRAGKIFERRETDWSIGPPFDYRSHTESPRGSFFRTVVYWKWDGLLFIRSAFDTRYSKGRGFSVGVPYWALVAITGLPAAWWWFGRTSVRGQ